VSYHAGLHIQCEVKKMRPIKDSAAIVSDNPRLVFNAIIRIVKQGIGWNLIHIAMLHP